MIFTLELKIHNSNVSDIIQIDTGVKDGHIISYTFICLFVLGFSSHSIIFHSYGDVTMTFEGLQIFTYTRHLWPLGSDGSLACHIYCDTGHPFKMVISEDSYCRAFGSGAVISCFTTQVCGWDSKTQTFRLRGERSNTLRHRCGSYTSEIFTLFNNRLISMIKSSQIIKNLQNEISGINQNRVSIPKPAFFGCQRFIALRDKCFPLIK